MLKKLSLLILTALLCTNLVQKSAYAKKAKIYTPEMQYKYEKKVRRHEAKENYHRSLLPQSGYMTKEEYEELSKDISNEERVIPEYKLPKDIKMKYVPQPIYKLARYNNPPGSPELKIDRLFKYDRQFICPGVTSPNKDILVYPVVYYYAANQCIAGDLFVVPLDKTLPDISRIQRANIIKRNPNPILSTEKNIEEKFIFRTITPIDFSTDGTKLIAKEKVGNSNDGIWQTNLWIYDFNTKTSRQIPEIREAIKFYWKNTENLILEEKRWDIYPLGFDAKNPDRIIVSAYGFTGKIPTFLGTWSIDTNGERTLLVNLFKENVPVTINGYKLIKEGVIEPHVVKSEEKRQNKIAKKKRKAEKKVKKLDKKHKKQELKKTLHEINKEEKEILKEYKNNQHTGKKNIGN